MELLQIVNLVSYALMAIVSLATIGVAYFVHKNPAKLRHGLPDKCCICEQRDDIKL